MSVQIAGLTLRFDEPVLCGVDLDVSAGEVSAVLGASGTGKSTLLRCIAGLQRPDSGRIILRDSVVDADGVHVPAHKRLVGLVPQEGALFPHLSVAENVGFGLKGRRQSQRIAQLLDLVGLPGAGGRRPHELSGGMQQRIAVARALAPRPGVIVLDEPFSALDAGLREEVREQVFRAIRADGATAVLVTHDREEAFAVADRVAVMMRGRVVQHDRPEQVYRRPVDLEVAMFVGETARIADRVFRPEDLALGAGEPIGVGIVTATRFHGHDSVITLRLGESSVQVRTLGAPDVAVGDRAPVGATGQGLSFS